MNAIARKDIAIKLSLQDAETVRMGLARLGAEGQAALERIERASQSGARGFDVIRTAGGGLMKMADGAVESLGAVGTALKALGPAGLAAAIPIAVFAKALADGVEEFKTSEQAMLRLQAVLKATGNASGLTADQIAGLANHMKSTTLATGTGVMEASTVLSTFRSVSGDTFTRTIKLAQDMSAVFGGDLRSATVTLGKALEDPVEGMTALRRVGLVLSQATRDAIAELERLGDRAGAQKLILGELERQIGGAGAAEASGLVGALHNARQAWGALSEEIVRATGRSQTMIWTAKQLANVLDTLRYGVAGPDLSRQIVGKNRELVEAEEALKTYDANRAKMGMLDYQPRGPLVARIQTLKREIEDLIAKARQESEELGRDAERAEQGKIDADLNRNRERLAERLESLRADKLKYALDPAEKIAAIREQMQKDLAGAEGMRGRIGTTDAEIDAQRDLIVEIARRQIETIEKPLREAEEKIRDEIAKVIRGLEYDAQKYGDPRGIFVDQALEKLPKKATNADRIEAAMRAEQAYDAKQRVDELKREIEDEDKRLARAREIARQFSPAATYEAEAKALSELEPYLRSLGMTSEEIGRAWIDMERKKLDASRDWADGGTRAVRKYIDEAENAAAANERIWTASMKGAEDAIVEFTTKGEISVVRMLQVIEQEMARSLIAKPLVAGFAKAFEGFNLFSFFESAHGNVFDGYGAAPFGHGGTFTNSIVSSPTYFAFGRGGALGVMGEAGPEAVMPLARDPATGNLGIHALGGRGGANVIVNNYGEPMKVQAEEDGAGNLVVTLIPMMRQIGREEADGVLKRYTQGGGMRKSLRDYGVQPQAVSRG